MVAATIRKMHAPNHEAAVLLVSGSPDENYGNGRFLAIVGEGEYVVYTSRQLRSKAFGEGTDFVWRPNSNAYCVQIVRLK